MVAPVRRAVPLLVAGAFLVSAAPPAPAIDGVTIHRETDPAVVGTSVHFTASPAGAADGLVLYDWGLECGPTGPFDWTTNTFSGGFDRVFATPGPHAVCVKAHDYSTAYTDAATFNVATPGNHKPVAALTITPGIAPVGGPVTFDAGGSSDPDQDALHYRFDIDGEPGYEVDNGSESKFTQTYVSSAAITAGVQVTDPSGAQDAATAKLVIGDPNPLKVRLAAHEIGRRVQVTVTTGRPVKVRIEVRTPDATLLASKRGKVNQRAHTFAIRLTRSSRRLVVIATATDASGVTVSAVRRIKREAR
jgi:predicted secreted protein